jgi:threonine-phosphate decarboxylase
MRRAALLKDEFTMTEPLPTHGGQLREIAERFGIPLSKLLDFSANINPEGPPPAVIPTLHASLEDLVSLGCYPDIEQTDLKQSLARYAGVAADNIVVANGFVPLLDAALRALKIRHCLMPVPAFVEYRSALTRARIKITPHLLSSDTNFAYNIESMLTGDHDAILLANPQNPSGVSCNLQTLLQLVASAAEKNIAVLLDEAFIDYLASESLSRYVERFPNLIVFRSVTKFHGIPGLRVAYAVTPVDVARLVAYELPPWPVTALAAHAVIAALGDAEYAERNRLLNRERRAVMQSELNRLGIHSYDSAANFLLLRLPGDINGDLFWQRMILDHDLVLRNCHNYEGLGDGHLRAAVRTELQNEALVKAASETLPKCRAGSSSVALLLGLS